MKIKPVTKQIPITDEAVSSLQLPDVNVTNLMELALAWDLEDKVVGTTVPKTKFYCVK